MSDRPRLFNAGFVDRSEFSLSPVHNDAIFPRLVVVELLRCVTTFIRPHNPGSILLFIKVNELEPWSDGRFTAHWSGRVSMN